MKQTIPNPSPTPSRSEGKGVRLTLVSGGQTGADRAALDFAIAHGISHGGWCPRGRIAEDGPIAERYQLQETPSRRYAQRTEWNVRDTDATVVFSLDRQVQGGTALTLRLARKLGRPWLHIARDDPQEKGSPYSTSQLGAMLRRFLKEHNVLRLNIAGPRASTAPDIASFVHSVLAETFGHVDG